jgi:D-amino-acid dehydrogenase
MDVLAAHGKPAGEVFRRLVEDESLDCEYQPRGQYDVFLSEDGMRGGEEEAELMRGYGYEVELVDGDELRRREPAFRDEIVGAALYPERAFCNPGRFVVEMAERARNAGAEMRSGSTVERLLITDDRCAGVELEGGERIEADRVLLAAGIWSSALAKQIDIRLPMQAGKGYHLNLTAPEPYLQTGCVCAERYVAVTPMAGGLRLAGTLEFSGINHEIVQKRVDMLRLGAARYLRGIEQAEPLSTWCGLRPCTADGLPVVGWAPNVGDLFLATGHAMMGFLFGPLTGQVACGCLLEEPPSVDIGPLSPDRFN